MAISRFNRHADRLVERHGCSVWRLGLDAGFSCPHRAGGRGKGGCAFCAPEAGLSPYQSRHGAGSAPTVSGIGIAPIGEQIARAMAFVRRRYGAEAFFPYFQAYSCTNLPVGELAAIYGEALDEVNRLAPGGLKGLVVSTRPDCFDEAKAALLSGYASQGLEVWVEFGLQSSNDATLERINRGHDAACFARAARIAGEAGLRRAVHLILGLPGETRETMLASLRFAVGCGIEGVKFHNLRLVRGSALANEYSAGEIAILHPGRLPALLADCIEALPPGVEVMRLCADFLPGATLDPLPPPDKSMIYRDVEAELVRRGTRQGDRA